jgi:Ca2+-binding EF-hand superfamily protein
LQSNKAFKTKQSTFNYLTNNIDVVRDFETLQNAFLLKDKSKNGKLDAENFVRCLSFAEMKATDT